MMEQFLIGAIAAFFALAGVLLLLRQPYLGLVVIVASLPIVDILPDIPFATSIFPVVGILTLGAHLVSLFGRNMGKPTRSSRRILLLGVLFVMWMLISNPYTALQPDADGRVWIFTFVQLLVLVWLASRLMDLPRKHFVLFTVYSLATAVSAFYAVANGGVADTIRESVRSAGLAGGANSAARYFLVALVFLYYLQVRQKNNLVRLLLFLLMALIILGTLLTVSRTGILLLVAAVGMLVVLERGREKPKAFILVLISLGIVWFFADNIIVIARTILPSIQSGSDTVGVRYGFWQAGMRMLDDYPLTGVGIGQYTQQLPVYGSDLLHREKYFSSGAHNMYVQIAAETGLVGLLIFMVLIFSVIGFFWNASRSTEKGITLIAKTWLVAFVLILIGGVTKHDHYDKLLWLMIGIGASSVWVKDIMVENAEN